MFRKKTWFFILCSTIVLAGSSLLYAWQAGWFDSAVHNVSVGTQQTTESASGTLDEAIGLARAAQAKLLEMPGYRCVYLRDERIDNELLQNSLLLTVLHEPFSVLMEWVEPSTKKGRKVAYITGKNNGKMRVKVGFATLSFDLNQSITMKESRHTINEAGLKNLMNRFVSSWEQEKLDGETATRYSDAVVEATVSGKHYSYSCRCIETDHPVTTRGKYVFHRTRIYFDKQTGLPVRMEGYDWPSGNETEGRLLERYSYFDVKTDPIPQLKQIEM